MASQTLIFAALPNGPGSKDKLKLSVYMTPRLEGGATLATFPDILNWTQQVQAHGLKFQITCGVKTAMVAVNTAGLRPDIWSAIFASDTFVEAYQFTDFTKQLIVSYPSRQALSFLKYATQFVATNPGSFGERGGPLNILRPLNFRQGSKTSFGDAISAIRVNLWKQQQAVGAPGGVAGEHQVAPTSNPDGVATALDQPDVSATRDMATRFGLFHHIPKAPGRPPFASTPADFKKALDFHAALTALNSYPSLLRALGLVFDVEIPASMCPDSPAGGAYGTIAVTQVKPGFTWKINPALHLNATSYWRDKDSFSAAPASAPAAQSAGNYVPGDVFKGFLALSFQDFFLSQVDLDGALLKALGLADNVQNLTQLGNIAAIEQTLPSLRSAGVSLMADGRALQLLQALQANKGFNDSLTAGGAAARAYNAQDLVRGYRIDIWSSRTKSWHSLHERAAIYKFGPDGKIAVKVDEEGFTQLAVAQPADDPTRKPDKFAAANGIPPYATNVYIHERVARWNGWSLSVSRPGKALNRSADPAKALDSDPTMNQAITPFKMTTGFTVKPHSLPELRFGANYRLRARTVDLAGNSVPLNASAPDAFVAPANSVPMKYMRFEPVSTPLVVLQQLPQLGASLERLVIRSRNTSLALDSTPTNDSDQRHIAPPRVWERMIEQHGLFDSKGKLNPDAATYNLITERDSFVVPTHGTDPLVPGPTFDVGYFPDPLARGAALRDLPNTPTDTNGRIASGGVEYSTLREVDAREGSVTFIDFGTQPWPNAQAFRLLLVEGTGLPAWDAAARVLTVHLQKGTMVTVPLSSYLLPPDLDIMGVWGWLRELFEALETSSVGSANADLSLSATSTDVAEVTRLVLEGGHEMITPQRTLTLVHAVQQPLGEPALVQLPVVHNPAAPIFASALRNSFTPITAWRAHESHIAVLLGGMQIHAASSSKVDLNARWLDVVDDPASPGPAESVQSQTVETFDLSAVNFSSTDPVLIYSDAAQTRIVAVYIPQVDVLWFAGPQDVLEGVSNPSSTVASAPLHRFDDTKHRWIVYSALATSRFQEYFPQKGLDFTRTGPTLVVDVPSSARPAAPDINYVIPVFGWENQETTNVKTSMRYGNGLRVYLNRGWYSSGQDEQLGVVLWPAAAAPPDYATREKNKALFSEWGADPIWANGSLTITPVPNIYDFPNAASTASGLTILESSATFDVAAHNVAYDSGRQLWYCDIQIGNLFTYSPFLRLALARYQSHSIQGVELSPIALADFVQLTPDRSAVLSINPSDPRNARLFVGGLAPVGPLNPVLQVSVETRAKNISSDLDWKPAAAADVTVTEDAPAPSEANAVLWSGSIRFTRTPPAGRYRVVIREFETIDIDAATQVITDPPRTGQRLVYAAILAYDYR
ncbi:MAG TPA: hypothetical protein VG273_10350 [Bryobacteraceae bacterium]|jgi:hypothetical protein|nr:hypothetical protein [Bryobacteraceae bacterium]